MDVVTYTHSNLGKYVLVKGSQDTLDPQYEKMARRSKPAMNNAQLRP